MNSKDLYSKGIAVWTVAAATLFSGCASVGPDYERPAAATPERYKAEELGSWKEGRPLDHLPKGRWWEIFGDPQLDALQAKALEANQELQAALASVDQARSVARIARSELFPTADLNASYQRERYSPNQEPSFGAVTTDVTRVPLDLSYEVDLWGRVRRGLEGARADAAASVAAFHNVSLILQADLAQNYFGLRALDTEIAVLRRTIELRSEQADIVVNRFDSGLGNELDVARARTELATTEAELAAMERRRDELENALAILVGEAPSSFRIAPYEDSEDVWTQQAPVVPAGLPSDLLERRPDIAEAERLLAAENARIGVARAAFFPAVRLTGSAGYVSSEVDSLFDWESRAWAFGPSVSLPLFTGGRNAANLERSEARYQEAVARYRQRVLVAFGEVENALSGLRHLADESAAQDRALASAQLTRDLALESFEIGIAGYLDVIEADRAALLSQRAQAQLAGQRYIATVQLVKALGGGWEAREDSGS